MTRYLLIGLLALGALALPAFAQSGQTPKVEISEKCGDALVDCEYDVALPNTSRVESVTWYKYRCGDAECGDRREVDRFHVGGGYDEYETAFTEASPHGYLVEVRVVWTDAATVAEDTFRQSEKWGGSGSTAPYQGLVKCLKDGLSPKCAQKLFANGNTSALTLGVAAVAAYLFWPSESPDAKQ